MPFSHLHRVAKEKPEPSIHHRMTNCMADLPIDRHDTDFSELLWGNGQILLQGQSNKIQKSSSNTNICITQEREEEHVLPIVKITHPVLNDFTSSGPSSRHMGMGQDDELAHWLNYPLDDYSSDFFSEFNQNAFSAPNNVVPGVKNSGYGQTVRDSHGGAHSEQENVSKPVREGPELTRTRGSQLYLSPRVQPLPSHTPRVVDSTGCNTKNAPPHDKKIQHQEHEPTQPSKNTGFTNFSHFLRPATLGKANRQNGNGAPGSSSLSVDKTRNNDKVPVVSCSNRPESTTMEYTNGSRSFTGHQSNPPSCAAKGDTNPAKEPYSIGQSQADCREDTIRKSRSSEQGYGQTSSFAASAAVGPDNDKYVETVVASSSVCSGNSAKNDLKHQFKRKSRDTEESDYRSEDIEEESVGIRRPAAARGTSTKRSRAAEVHNLSERKRRDRINEKMRALQELIPNCNKVDKASMLDEAIEYLKTLQLQVQIMSMGSGMFMPPMMLHNGMQHVSAPHLPPFSPMNAGMGMGMGMGMGFGMGLGMGMVDLSGGSTGCPMQVPAMHGAQYPYPPIPGPSSLPMMAGSSHQMFGPPSQGIAMPMPRAPFFPPSGGPCTKSSLLPVVSGAATPMDSPNIAMPSSSKDLSINAHLPNRNAECSQNEIAAQVTKGGFDQPAVAQRHDHPPQLSGND